MAQTASSSLRKLILDGTEYPVSPEFADTIKAVLGTLTFDTASLKVKRQALMDSRANPRALDAVTHIENVANAIRVVGAHHDPVEEWGLDGWDAVHGNAHHQDCGCIKHYIFDHHSATNHFGHNRVTTERKHHEVEPLRVCEIHKAR